MGFIYNFRVIDRNGLSERYVGATEYEGDFNMEDFVKEIDYKVYPYTKYYAILVETPPAAVSNFMILHNDEVSRFTSALSYFVSSQNTKPKGYRIIKRNNPNTNRAEFQIEDKNQVIIGANSYNRFSVVVSRDSDPSPSLAVYLNASKKLFGIYQNPQDLQIHNEAYVNFDSGVRYKFMDSIYSIDAKMSLMLNSYDDDIKNINAKINSDKADLTSSIAELSGDMDKLSDDIQSITGDITNRYVSR